MKHTWKTTLIRLGRGGFQRRVCTKCGAECVDSEQGMVITKGEAKCPDTRLPLTELDEFFVG